MGLAQPKVKTLSEVITQGKCGKGIVAEGENFRKCPAGGCRLCVWQGRVYDGGSREPKIPWPCIPLEGSSAFSKWMCKTFNQGSVSRVGLTLDTHSAPAL